MSWSAIIEPSDLTQCRLVAEYYAPDSLEKAHAVRQAGWPIVELADLIDAPINNSIRDVNEHLNVRGASIPMFRPADMDGWWVSTASAPLVTPEFEEQHEKARVVHGDIVLAIAGTIGKMGRVPPNVSRGCINGSSARIRPRVSVRSYVIAYLNSVYGQSALRRLGVGSVQKHLNLEDLPAVPVLLPDEAIQRYIGQKVDLAEKCRSTGLEIRAAAIHSLRESWELDEMEGEVANLVGERAHVVSTEIFDDRLDAEYYQPWHLHVADELDRRDCWKLRDLIHPPTKGVQPAYERDGTIPALTVTHIDPYMIDRRNAEQAVTANWLQSNERARIHTDEVLITVTGPPLGEAVVVEDFHLPAAINSHIARIRMQKAFPFPNLLAAMLNSQLGQWQTTRYCKGIRQKELYPEDLLRFRFPKLPRHLLEGLEDNFRTACVLMEKARALVDEAKADVEALVDGTLDIPAILSGRLAAPTYDTLMRAIATKAAR